MSDQVTSASSDLLLTPVGAVIARKYTCQLPSQLSVLDDDLGAPVSSWLVGACHRGTWGWWGPVNEATAKYAVEIFEGISDLTPAVPETWAERARYGTRHAHAGIGALAIGALELAIWDLVGQQSGRPIWALFRDYPERPTIPAYASCLGYNGGAKSTCEIAKQLAERGWLIQKWRPIYGRDGVRAMQRLIESVAAEGGQIALDLGGAWSIETVIEYFAEMTARCAWIEEPVPPWRLMDISLLPNLPGPIAAGEHCYSPQDMLLLALAGIAVWQPDAVFCGGFSALRACIRLAETHEARVLPHGGGLLAAVHAGALEPIIDCIEWHLSIEPRRQAHLSAPVLPAAQLTVPTAPGWGGPLVPKLRL